MWLKRRILPRLAQILFRLVDSDPLIRDAVTFGAHAGSKATVDLEELPSGPLGHRGMRGLHEDRGLDERRAHHILSFVCHEIGYKWTVTFELPVLQF